MIHFALILLFWRSKKVKERNRKLLFNQKPSQPFSLFIKKHPIPTTQHLSNLISPTFPKFRLKQTLRMKKNSIVLAVMMLAAFTASAQSDKKTLTPDDYDKATKALGMHASKLVYRYNVNPTWLPDGTFWYSVNVEGGKEFVLINPADGSRKTGADKKSILPDDKPAPRRGGPLESVSPDGKKAAFIKDWNLWVKDLDTANF
jgi:hypothetical protein